MRSVIPRTTTKTLRWTSDKAQIIVDNAGNTGTVAFKANSIVNPGSSAKPTTDLHEPLGFTQLQAMYDTYCVKKATIRFDYFNSHTGSSGDPDAAVIGISVKDDSSGLSAFGHYEELGNSVWTGVSPEGTGKLVYDVVPSTFFGVNRKNAISDPTLRALMSGNSTTSQPTNLLWFHCWAHGVGATSTAFNIEGYVTIDYEVQFSQPADLAQSNYTP